MRAVYLTTDDNPFDPHLEFEQWYVFDMDMGYDSCGLLDRIFKDSELLPDSFREKLLEEAIDEIVKYNVSGHHKKLVKDVPPPRIFKGGGGSST